MVCIIDSFSLLLVLLLSKGFVIHKQVKIKGDTDDYELFVFLNCLKLVSL